MRSSDVTFRKSVVDDSVPADQRKEIESIEIRLPNGDVAVLPATDIDTESGQRYCDLYPEKYSAFKRGEPDRDRVAQLRKEIDDRQAELDATDKPKDADRKRPDAQHETPRRAVHKASR